MQLHQSAKIVSFIWNVEQDIWGNQFQGHDYIALPSVSILEYSSNLLLDFDFDSQELLAGLRNSQEETSENRKFDISGVLCIEVESENRTTQQISEELDAIENCNICYEDKQNRHMVSLNCNHNFCGTCLSTILKK